VKKVEVFGPGCVKCQKLAENVREASKEAGVDIELVKVEDMFAIMSRGCNRTPGIAIDGKLRLQGRIATVKEIKDWLQAD
jgi:small redox-active disulfide protein 2